MTEQLVSFETAKLAKEKGFDIEVDTYLTDKNPDKYRKLKMRTSLCNFNKIDTIYSRPTQSLLQKWLREVHNIEVIVFPKSHSIKGIIYVVEVAFKCQVYHITYDGVYIGYETYEEALEVGLQEALKSIK